MPDVFRGDFAAAVNWNDHAALDGLSDRHLADYFDMVMGLGHNAALGMRLVDHGRGWSRLAIDWREDLVDDPVSGEIASGIVLALLDVASGTAVWTAVGGAALSVTLDLHVDYLGTPRRGHRVVALVECYHLEDMVAFVRGHAHDGDPDRPIASLAGSFFYSKEG
jgi:uncharacterized protein (TIGR00369 family)